MIVSREEVLRIAGLAKLALKPGEAETLAAQLASILEHMEILVSAGVEELSSANAGEPAPQRVDVPARDPLVFPPELLSPASESGFFTVPRIAALDSEA